MSAPLRLVVFDVDGTLIDSQAHILASMAAAFAGAGLPMPARAQALGVVGLSLPLALGRLAPGAAPDVLDAMVAAYKAAFHAQRQATTSPLYPGALAALDRLGRRPETLLGIATGKSRRGLDHVLAMHDLRRHFVTAQVADDHPSKPHPAMLQSALRDTGAAAADAVMVGDTVYDIEMARAAGLRSIGVTWGYHPAEALRQAGADALIGGFAELDAALHGLWTRV